MIRPFFVCLSVALVTAVLPMRAANRPHAGRKGQKSVVWTNDDLARLHGLGLISIVGQSDDEKPTSASLLAANLKTQDREWYAEQAARLRDNLERRQAQLREYRQALDDARSLRASTGGIDLVGDDFAITPEAGIEVLQQRVSDTQTKLDELEDLARRNDIEAGTLRPQ